MQYPTSRLRPLAFLILAAALLVGCKRKHVSVASVPELGYPRCAASGASGIDGGLALGPEVSGEVVAAQRMRSGPFMADRNVVESFEIRKTGCGFVYDGREEWPLMSADVQVVYDENLTPLRAWKRMTIPGVKRADGMADIRRYELRTPDVTIKRHTRDGETLYERLLPGGRLVVPTGAKPAAIVAPGRGILSMWIRRAKLPVGGKVRELVLDIREMIEVLEEATLAREEDRFEPSLNKTVRVYTFYGRESVFTDENDVVIGDLAGMRPSESLSTPEPAPMPMYGAPDPINTP